MKNGKILLFSLFMSGSIFFSTSAMAQSDSDLVRAAKEKSAQKAKHVYTDSDFPQHPEAAPAEAVTGTIVSATAGAAKASDSGPSGEAKSSDTAGVQGDASKPGDAKSDSKPDGKADATSKQNAKLADLKDKLAQTKRDEEALQQKLDTLDEKAKDEKDEFRKNMYLDMVSNQQLTLSEYRRTEEQLQKQINEGKNEEKTDNKEPQ